MLNLFVMCEYQHIEFTAAQRINGKMADPTPRDPVEIDHPLIKKFMLSQKYVTTYPPTQALMKMKCESKTYTFVNTLAQCLVQNSTNVTTSLNKTIFYVQPNGNPAEAPKPAHCEYDFH
jgi:hypothetical protein